MTKAEAISFLDKVVESSKTIRNLDGQFGIETITKIDDFLIYSGIMEICKALEIEPIKEWRTDSKWNIKIHFEYQGVRFYELCHAEIPAVDIKEVRIEPKGNEALPMDDTDARISAGMFGDMDKVIGDFDEATKNIHVELGTLGVVE